MSVQTTQLETAKETLFGKAGIGASNFKIFPGTDRNATAEEVAAEINESIQRVVNGELEEVKY